jgi:Positive regulator of sigma E activity
MAEQVDKTVCIPNSGIHVVKGETVNVVMEASAGIQSVFLAYVIPVILLVCGIVLFSILSFPDFVAALLSLAAVAAYYFLLFLMRGALAKKFVMRIEKL